jgi:hypothetical protein
MHYVTRRFHWMQKHKLDVTCSEVLFMEIAPGPPKKEKLRINISCPGGTGMHYVTHRSHRMHKKRSV